MLIIGILISGSFIILFNNLVRGGDDREKPFSNNQMARDLYIFIFLPYIPQIYEEIMKRIDFIYIHKLPRVW